MILFPRLLPIVYRQIDLPMFNEQLRKETAIALKIITEFNSYLSNRPYAIQVGFVMIFMIAGSAIWILAQKIEQLIKNEDRLLSELEQLNGIIREYEVKPSPQISDTLVATLKAIQISTEDCQQEVLDQFRRNVQKLETQKRRLQEALDKKEVQLGESRASEARLIGDCGELRDELGQLRLQNHNLEAQVKLARWAVKIQDGEAPTPTHTPTRCRSREGGHSNGALTPPPLMRARYNGVSGTSQRTLRREEVEVADFPQTASLEVFHAKIHGPPTSPATPPLFSRQSRIPEEKR